MTTISYPFRINARGSIATTRDPRKVNVDRVRAVLSTQVGDRPMRPGFGTDTSGLIMEMQHVGDTEVNRRVKQAFKDHLPGLHLQRIRVVPPTEDSQTGTITVEFNGPDGSTDATSVTFTDGIVTNDPYSTYEETL